MVKNPIIKYILQNQVLAALIIILIGWFVFTIKDILILLFISYIIMAALSPAVDELKKRRVPKALAVVVPFLAVLLFLVILIFPLIPFFAGQVQALFNSLPHYVNNAADVFGFNINALEVESVIKTEINTITRNAFAVTAQVFGGIFSFLTILVVSFYLLLDRDHIKKGLLSLVPKASRPKVRETLELVNERLGGWLRGQIVLSVFIGIITWIALTIVGMPNALPLALIAAMLEIVPTIGPIVAAIPAILIALTVSPNIALIVTVIYIGIQILENNVLVPRIMQKAVGLNPVVVIIGIIIGGKLLGVAGALLSIPFISMLIVIYKSLQDEEDEV